ncbi:MAG TPA: hypothetical protein VFY16_03975 [Gemmatimonadaceae bacterium]|nr:hypothetical protein [Gemmatimonadaceae bacterium]
MDAVNAVATSAVLKVVQAQSRVGRRRAWRLAPPRVVREPEPGEYENEGSEQRSTGAVAVGGGAWWSATLAVPMPADGAAFLRVERHGAVPAGYRGAGESAELSLPAGEAGAVVVLLAGLVAQARRDGVLPRVGEDDAPANAAGGGA